jgi:SAM-dependent methyltransferase
MSYPFIIWTMQRTGGTALADLLMEISEHQPAEHEPFNWRRNPRQFAYVTRDWNDTGDEESLVEALADILSQRYLIKHCYELHGMPFNARLMEAASKANYRHIHLLRRDEFSRLISKFIAEANGTWFKDYATEVFARVRDRQRVIGPLPIEKVVAHYRHCQTLSRAVRNQMDEAGIVGQDIYYEDLFIGEREQRLARLQGLLRFLDFDPETIEQNHTSIEAKIFHSGFDTASIAQFVPNLKQTTEALSAAGCRPPAEEHPGTAAKMRLSKSARPSSGWVEEGKVVLRDGQNDDKARFVEKIANGQHRRLVGGLWDKIGQLQLEFLKQAGLRPDHRVLDIGCGCLRAGVKLVAYLEPNHYFGIDAEKKLLEIGYRQELAKVGLKDRLDRGNLYCSRLCQHQRLAENTIEYGICVSVITHLPLSFLMTCLQNTEKYFKRGGKLYVSFFEIPEQATFSQPVANSNGNATPSFADPYHYYRKDMVGVAEGTLWRPRYIGEWGHPRGQAMVEYERI